MTHICNVCGQKDTDEKDMQEHCKSVHQDSYNYRSVTFSVLFENEENERSMV